MSAAAKPVSVEGKVRTTRDAAIYFRDGKLLAVETDAGTFTLADLKARRVLTTMDGMVLGQLTSRVDALIGQLNSTGENQG